MEWLIRYGGNAEGIPGYDCKLSNREPGTKNYIVGTAFIIYGLFAEFIYMIDLTVMLKKKHRRLSCYKIMIVLGVYDMAAISLNSLLTGYFWIKGANYCTNPTLMFVAGTAALGLWCGACMNCFVLVINRLLDVWNKSIMEAFYNYPHTANNLLIVVITCLLLSSNCLSATESYHPKRGTGTAENTQTPQAFPTFRFEIADHRFIATQAYHAIMLDSSTLFVLQEQSAPGQLSHRKDQEASFY
ncbi:hypothetical protein ANCDUO_01999 [Ancylostoma duodenale]|uniref:Uncharacterized protein n=1 Tax=Ancylostoma duodenale TaxID=51022 RepID=A0A0C2DXI6_9BILA|nr:hypothetical protein ANCDUO_01999 [Ancylostoma duodenale]